MSFLLILLLAVLSFALLSLQKTYNHLPSKELKRRAAAGDEFASRLHHAVAHGASLSLLLWVFSGLALGSLFVALSDSLPTTLALIAVIAVWWLGTVWLPNSPLTTLGARVAWWLTPGIAWILEYTAPLLNRAERTLGRFHEPPSRHDVFEKKDLLTLLNDQAKQLDNRINEEELRIAHGALTFGDKTVGEVMIPRRMIKTVKVTDAVGPVLMNELHDSGLSRFPVIKGKDQVVGVLNLRDLSDGTPSGKVEDYMDKKAHYVHEETSLVFALQAIIKTHRHLLVVVNRFEDIVGVITLEDILEQIIGRPIVDEFDRYDDLQAVANREAKAEHSSHQAQEVIE